MPLALASNECFQVSSTPPNCGIREPVDAMFVFFSILLTLNFFYQLTSLICACFRTPYFGYTLQAVAMEEMKNGLTLTVPGGKFIFPKNFDQQLDKVKTGEWAGKGK